MNLQSTFRKRLNKHNYVKPGATSGPVWHPHSSRGKHMGSWSGKPGQSPYEQQQPRKTGKAEHPDEYYSGSQPGSRTNPRRAAPPYPGFGAESQRRDRAIAPVTERQLTPRKQSKRGPSINEQRDYPEGRPGSAEAASATRPHAASSDYNFRGRTVPGPYSPPTHPQVASQGPRAKRRAGAQAQAQEQVPRKQSKDILMGTGQTPQAGKPKQGVWAQGEFPPGVRPKQQPRPPVRSAYGEHPAGTQVARFPRRQTKQADWQTHTHKPGDPYASQHGPDSHTHRTPTGRVKTVMGQPRRQSKDIVGKMQKAFRKRWTGKKEGRVPHGGPSGNVKTHEHMIHGQTQPHSHSPAKHPEMYKADPHGGPAGGQGRLHGHMGPGGETHEHDYGEHGGVKISPPSPLKPDQRGQPGYGSGYSQHERVFGHPASHASKAVSQSVVSPHPAPQRTGIAGGVPEKHQLRIARQNANMNPAMRGVMGAGDVHEHTGAAHGHPDAWTAHAHKALRKRRQTEQVPDRSDYPYASHESATRFAEHQRRFGETREPPKPRPTRTPKPVTKAVRAAVRLAIPTGGDPAPVKGTKPQPKVPQSKLQTPKQRAAARQKFAREQWGGR